ncbi:MAG: 50S ribosomal protein L31e [Candidatus Diapherotrites archaeon]
MAEKKTTTKEIEREYIIPLREKIRPVPRYRKTPKAIKSIKEFLAKHMKVENRDLNKIKISPYLNQFMWARGIKNPPTKIKVKATKKGENIIVDLVNYPKGLEFNRARKEKQEKEALESIENKKTMMKRMKENLQKPKVDETEENKEKAKEDEEKAKETKEKTKTSAESTKEIEKAQAKQAKHQTEKTKKTQRPIRVALQK